MVRHLAAALALWAGAAVAEPGFGRLEGHGGPVQSVEVEGGQALTASFDNSAGLWQLEHGTVVWLEGHVAAVNVAVFAGDGRAITAGDDFDLIIWDLETAAPLHRLEGHQGKVMAVAISPDGTRAASASWDGTIGLWDLETGRHIRWLDHHASNVNDVVWSSDGATLWSASYDGTVRRFDLTSGTSLVVRQHGFGVNVLAIDEAAGWLAYGALDGGAFVLDLSGEVIANLSADRRPVLAVARSPDGRRIAFGDGEGYIHVVSTDGWRTERDFHAVARGPVWGLAFTADSEGLVSAGLDDFATIWPIAEAASVAEDTTPRRFHLSEGLSNGERQFARKCSICHTLGPDGERRAGPTLHALFGRPAGSLAGYAYSDALTGSDIVWTAETIDLLFDLGPDHYTPGSKMPMQRITAPEDRADLIAFLREATKPEGETP